MTVRRHFLRWGEIILSNLIITIISIAIVTVAVAMGIYYGGIAYENAQINATANAIVNEAQQILQAERMWATDHNQPDICSLTGGMSTLVNQHYLSEWPYISTFESGPQPNTGSVTNGSWDSFGVFHFFGYSDSFYRFMFSYNNGNYVVYDIRNGQGYPPFLQVMKTINQSLKGTYSFTGPPTGSTLPTTYCEIADGAMINNGHGGYVDSNGAVVTGCYSGNHAVCVFGPS